MNSANAAPQLPAPGEVPRLMRTTSHSTSAPDISRIVVKVAASMVVCVSAIRQSSELAAKAIIKKNTNFFIVGNFKIHVKI